MNKGTKGKKWKLGSGLNLPMWEQRDGNRRGFDTKVIRSERNFPSPVRRIEKWCRVTAPHAGVKIKARGSALFLRKWLFWPHARLRPTREIARLGWRSEEREGEGRRVTPRSLAEVFTGCDTAKWTVLKMLSVVYLNGYMEHCLVFPAT